MSRKPGCQSGSCACAAASTSSPSSSSDAVKLPRRNKSQAQDTLSSDGVNEGIEGGVWRIDNGNSAVPPTGGVVPSAMIAEKAGSYCALLSDTSDAISEKCDARNGQTCCKEKVEEGRNLVSHDFVRDVIIGLSDGLMVPFALTAGLSSLGSSKLVYQGGFAELISGAISMGIGGYLAAKAEQDTFRHKHAEYTRKLEVACESELERDVHEVLGSVGISQNVSRVVARSLQQADAIQEQPDPKSKVRHRFSWRRQPVPTTGTTAFVLKFGSGMEEVPDLRLFVSALTIGLSYFIGGLIPIIPYFCVSDALHGLYWSILATGIILILFGIAKSWFTGAAQGFLGLLWGALSTLAVGAAAAAASYGVVRGLEHSGAA